MPEHLIRLRGGWLWLEPQARGQPPDPSMSRRLTLPMPWPQGSTINGSVRLTRSFATPRIDPEREILLLRLEHVHGLVSAELNDREITRSAPETTAIDIPLPYPLPSRNRLVLEVEPPLAGVIVEQWGVIALVIVTRSEPWSEHVLGETEPRA
jgi:hypothetical protein